MKLRVHNGECRLFAYNLKLEHAYLEGDRLHQETLRADVIHQEVKVLVEVLLFPHCHGEARDAQLLQLLWRPPELGIAAFYMWDGQGRACILVFDLEAIVKGLLSL